MNIRFTERFLRTIKKLPRQIADDTCRVIAQIEKPKDRDPLHIYPLKGKFRGLSALSINFAYHAIVLATDENLIFLDVSDSQNE